MKTSAGISFFLTVVAVTPGVDAFVGNHQGPLGQAAFVNTVNGPFNTRLMMSVKGTPEIIYSDLLIKLEKAGAMMKDAVNQRLHPELMVSESTTSKAAAVAAPTTQAQVDAELIEAVASVKEAVVELEEAAGTKAPELVASAVTELETAVADMQVAVDSDKETLLATNTEKLLEDAVSAMDSSQSVESTTPATVSMAESEPTSLASSAAASDVAESESSTLASSANVVESESSTLATAPEVTEPVSAVQSESTTLLANADIEEFAEAETLLATSDPEMIDTVFEPSEPEMVQATMDIPEVSMESAPEPEILMIVADEPVSMMESAPEPETLMTMAEPDMVDASDSAMEATVSATTTIEVDAMGESGMSQLETTLVDVDSESLIDSIASEAGSFLEAAGSIIDALSSMQ
jgi:hypothetical protein